MRMGKEVKRTRFKSKSAGGTRALYMSRVLGYKCENSRNCLKRVKSFEPQYFFLDTTV